MHIVRSFDGKTDTKISITESDFLAQGGEKKVYVKGSTAYCVYLDSKNCPPIKKLEQLHNVKSDSFICPTNLLLDDKGVRVGETMPYVSNSYVLCQLFNNKFRQNVKYTHDNDILLILKMADVMKAAHKANVILVDPNDMNWLVSKDLKNVSLIDTSSCRTPSYQASAIKPAILDPIAKEFTKKSDYYSLAVIATWLWCGTHPFVVSHVGIDNDMSGKMVKGISIFDSRTEFNAAMRKPDSMPSVLRQWCQKTLAGSLREPPPTKIGKQKIKTIQVGISQASGVTLTLLRTFCKNITSVAGDLVVCGTDLYKGGNKIATEFSGKLHSNYKSGVRLAANDTKVRDLNKNTEGSFSSKTEVIESESGFFTVTSKGINRITVLNNSKGITTTQSKLVNLVENPSRVVGEGCVAQVVLGKTIVATEKGSHVFDSASKILYCKYVKGVIQLVTKKTTFTKFVETGHLEEEDVQPKPPNFIVTDSGIMVENKGELFCRVVKNPLKVAKAKIDPGIQLFTGDGQVLGVMGKKLFKVEMG